MKKYAQIVSLSGAKSRKVIFRDDDERRDYAVAHAENMLVTKSGTIATRFSTKYQNNIGH